MGIKTYSIAETKEILRKAGFEVKGADGVLYIPSKLILRKKFGMFNIDIEDGAGTKQIYSGFSEDEACRNVLHYLKVKTIRNKVKK